MYKVVIVPSRIPTVGGFNMNLDDDSIDPVAGESGGEDVEIGMLGLPLYAWVVVAAVIGVAIGLWLGPRAAPFEIPTRIILNAIKAIGTPLVVMAILNAIVANELHGRQAAHMMLYYLLNTLIAMLIGITLCNTIKPGHGAELIDPAHPIAQPARKSVTELIVELVPASIGEAFSKNNLAQLVLITLALGIGLAGMRDQARIKKSKSFQTIIDLLDIGFHLLMKVLLWIVAIVPLAVLGVVASSVGQDGFHVFRSLGWFIVVVLIGLGCQISWYLVLNAVFARISPLRFIKASANVCATAFSSSSTAATIPVTLKSLENKLGVSRASSRLAACVGTNFNNDGTALYQASAVLFLAQALDVKLTTFDQILIMITTLIASVGAGGIPSGSFVTLPLIFAAVNLPPDKIPLLLTIDWFLDRCRTVSNVLGDMTVAVLLDLTARPPKQAGSDSLDSDAEPSRPDPV